MGGQRCRPNPELREVIRSLSALSSEVVMTVSDLISRDDAIEAVGRFRNIDGISVWHNGIKESIRIAIIEDLAKLPSAEVVLQTPQTYGKSINPNTEIVSDLISRQDAINCCSCLHPEECWDEIRKLPSAVEVVRCKDCKHAHMTYGGECKYCDMWEEDGEALYLDGDFYCAYGERREP